jgi:type IV pilus assembly protein PilA
MSNTWYYADRAGQQQGPVAADWLAAALQRGEVTLATLVWREGLADWQPLSAHAAELGVQGGAAPPPPPRVAAPGGQPRVVAPARGSNLAVVLVVVGAIVLFGGGILAAIAIPAYQDYTVRARLASALGEVSALRVQVAEARIGEERCLYNGEDGIGDEQSYASQHLTRVVVGELEGDASTCAIQLFLRDLGTSSIPEGATVLLKLQSDGSWRYESDVPPRYLPAGVRAALD